VHLVFHVLYVVAQLWVVCAIARAILSWFPLGYDSGWARLNHVLVRVTEPLIAPVRRLFGPMQVGGVGIDLAFIVVILFVEVIANSVLLPLSS
jgi:YggT family protein